MPSSPTPTRTPTRSWSTACSPARTTASGWRCPWLDAARYADSNGFQQDGDTWQWVWRDWVVRALNDDMPFDQFTIRLLAGDLLPGATTEDRIASGFNRNHLLNGEGGAIAEEQRFVNLFDRVDTTATTWLGLTMACAQCHDHKYDPITQKDYYSLLDAFNRVPESGTPQFFSSRIRVAAPFVELPTDENTARIAEFEAKIKAADAEAKPIVRSRLRGLAAGDLRRRQARRGEGPARPRGGHPAEARGRARRQGEAGARSGPAQAFRREGPAGPRGEAAGARAGRRASEAAQRLPRRSDPAGHDHERRQSAADGDPRRAAST